MFLRLHGESLLRTRPYFGFVTASLFVRNVSDAISSRRVSSYDNSLLHLRHGEFSSKESGLLGAVSASYASSPSSAPRRVSS